MKRQSYFDRQRSLYSECAKCALNNFMGEKTFSTTDLDNICEELSNQLINPHKSIFGGDYDINVLIRALQLHDYELRWLKKTEKLYEVITDQNWKGFFINIEKKKKIWHVLFDKSARHWCCLKRMQNSDEYGYFDSEEEECNIMNCENAICFIENLRTQDQTILVIQKPKQMMKQEQQSEQVENLTEQKP